MPKNVKDIDRVIAAIIAHPLEPGETTTVEPCIIVTRASYCPFSEWSLHARKKYKGKNIDVLVHREINNITSLAFRKMNCKPFEGDYYCIYRNDNKPIN